MIRSSLDSSVKASSLPAVSVVVPVRNRPASIAKCLESLLRSEYPKSRLEIICVDNGSTDETPQVLSQYRPRVKVVTENKLGPAAARNAGIRAAEGELVAFTDSDCTVESKWLRSITAPLLDSSIGIVGGRILAKRPCSSVGLFGEAIHDHERAIRFFEPPYAISMNMALRREAILAVGLFDERLLRCEDVDLSWRILQRGMRLKYRADAVVYHSNRNTIPELMREGFQHGFHAPQMHRLHARFIKEFDAQAQKQRSHGVVQPAIPAIPAWKRRVYSRLFYASRQAGIVIGRRLGADLPHLSATTCTTNGI